MEFPLETFVRVPDFGAFAVDVQTLEVVRVKPRSRYKGVTWNRRYRKWCVRIGVNGRRLFLGYFADEIEAAKVYDKAAQQHHGEFACTNLSE